MHTAPTPGGTGAGGADPADVVDLDALVGRLPQPGAARLLELLRDPPPAAPEGPDPGVPRPVIGRPPGERFGVLARYPCPRGCGWHHAERPDLPPPLRITLPAAPTGGDIDRAITGHARRVAAERDARVRAAIAGHIAGRLGAGCPAAPAGC